MLNDSRDDDSEEPEYLDEGVKEQINEKRGLEEKVNAMSEEAQECLRTLHNPQNINVR